MPVHLSFLFSFPLCYIFLICLFLILFLVLLDWMYLYVPPKFLSDQSMIFHKTINRLIKNMGTTNISVPKSLK